VISLLAHFNHWLGVDPSVYLPSILDTTRALLSLDGPFGADDLVPEHFFGTEMYAVDVYAPDADALSLGSNPPLHGFVYDHLLSPEFSGFAGHYRVFVDMVQ
jgi:hypothetical protein